MAKHSIPLTIIPITIKNKRLKYLVKARKVKMKFLLRGYEIFIKKSLFLAYKQ